MTTTASRSYRNSEAALQRPQPAVPPTALDEATPSHLLELAVHAARGSAEITLTDAAWDKVERAHRTVERLVAAGATSYGVTTGVGALANAAIDERRVDDFQRRLLRSHAAGCGAPLSRELTALVLLLRLRVLARGFSGPATSTIRALLRLVQHGILPVLPSRGSVGASGDLAPLAHAMLPLIGEGMCTLPDGSTVDGARALELAGLAPVSLGAKEGLSLMNGTALSTALALDGVARVTRLLRAAVLTTAAFYQGLGARRSPLDARVAAAHGFPGTIRVSGCFRHLLDLAEYPGAGERGQDPYSLRCAPQILGAVHDELLATWAAVERALDCVTDNPLIDVETGEFLSGGNFHGIAVGRICDRLALCVSNVASLLDRQLAYAIDGSRTQLPNFLIPEPGLNSGFMMHQVTTAALTSECRLLAIPAGLETIPTSNGQEDHVPMAPLSGWRLLDALERATDVAAIALLAAVQACRLNVVQTAHGPMAELLADAATRIPPIHADRVLTDDIARARDLMFDHAERRGLREALGLP